jgi:hypothetical protein
VIPPAWLSHPDEVDAKVRDWQAARPDTFAAEAKTQFAGRPVWALTVTDKSVPDEDKRKLLCFKPHAHEPAPIAAQMNVVHQLLTGETLDGRPSKFDRERILRECLLVFMPDANPDGTARAPVEAWDGSQYTNDEFWAWMRGIDPETGKMWKRVDLWDDRQENPLPLRYGIVYEQISPHEYVEPNRHHASTLFQWIFEWLRRFPRWDQFLSLHQTEFVNQPLNCMMILPCLYHELPPEIQEYSRQWAEEIVAAWGTVEGALPLDRIEPLKYTGQQRQYFVERWGDLYPRVPIITSEIQNNSPQTPPVLQQRLNEVAIRVSIERLLQ